MLSDLPIELLQLVARCLEPMEYFRLKSAGRWLNQALPMSGFLIKQEKLAWLLRRAPVEILRDCKWPNDISTDNSVVLLAFCRGVKDLCLRLIRGKQVHLKMWKGPRVDDERILVRSFWLKRREWILVQNHAIETTVLHMAAYYGNAEICKMLLDHGVDVNCLDKHDTSSLDGAVYGGNFDVCQLLLDRGARFQERERDYTGFIYRALSHNTEATALLLIERGFKLLLPSSRDSFLYGAAMRGMLQAVKALVEKGATYTSHGNYEETPFDIAIRHGNMEVCHYLLSLCPADKIHSLTKTGLCFMALEGNLQLCTWLLDLGVDPNGIQWEGHSPLSLAAERGHLEICQLLLERGASLTQKKPNYRIPLKQAVSQSQLEVVKLFMNHDPSVYDATVDDDGNHSLYLAAKSGSVEICKHFVESGVDVDEWCLHDRTPLFSAAQAKTTDICEYLLSVGADVNHKDKDGWTALIWAAYSGKKGMCQLLIDHGAEIPDAIPPSSYSLGQDRLRDCNALLKGMKDDIAANA